MKTKRFIVAACIGLTLGLVSCSDADAPQVSVSDQNNEDVLGTSPLAKALQSVIENSNKKEDSYILYDSSSDSLMILTAGDYELATAFSILVVKDENNISSAPAGPGWKLGGSGKGKYDAIKISSDLSKKLPAKQNFEIRVEYQKDGSYKVYYRLT